MIGIIVRGRTVRRLGRQSTLADLSSGGSEA